MARNRSVRVEQTRPPAAPWDDEELPRPALPDWMPSDRWRRPAAWIAVPLVVVACFWRLAHLDVPPTPSAAPSAVSVDVPDPDNIVVRTVAPARGASVFSDDGDGCPPRRSCRTSSAMAIGTLMALRSVYPSADVATMRTVTLHTADGPRLWSRSLTAAVPGRTVTVSVSSIDRRPGSGRLGTGKDVLVYAERRNGPYVVRVTVAGPAPRLAAVLNPAARLAADPRIVETA